jgi:hypothetical protein
MQHVTRASGCWVKAPTKKAVTVIGKRDCQKHFLLSQRLLSRHHPAAHFDDMSRAHAALHRVFTSCHASACGSRWELASCSNLCWLGGRGNGEVMQGMEGMMTVVMMRAWLSPGMVSVI